MEFSKETINQIATNAKAAQDVWKEYAHNNKLCESFHLRPTGSGIAIISILPYAPMRGITVSPKKLKDELNKIVERLDVLLGVDEDKALVLMAEWGFKKRSFMNEKSDNFIEENVQAHFIQGMILKQDMYEGIDFIASELILADKSSRFDIVGHKDGTLYIFEMKKDRKIAGFNQTAGYAKLIEDNKPIFLEVLRSYPHCPVDDFEKICAIAVMRYAANSAALLADKASEAGVSLWFFERSIALRKASV